MIQLRHMAKHLDIKIYGRVIGVGFRWSAKGQADKLGICGIVRNVDEDRVEAEAEGEEPSLKKFLAWCRKGPFWAKVERVESAEGKMKGYKDFRVVI